MNAIPRYVKAKQELALATAFVALLDAPSNGKVVDVVMYGSIKDKGAVVTAMPRVMSDAVENQARQKADNIFRAALQQMQAELVAIAVEAKAEYAAIAADAGVVVP